MRPGRDNIPSPDLPTDLAWVGVEPESMPALTAGGPALVHVDAYRLGGGLELDDLDLDTSVVDSVTATGP